MARSNLKRTTSVFGGFIRELRGSLKAEEFLRKLGYPESEFKKLLSMLSKIETGVTKTPGSDFLDKVASFSKKTVQQLEQMAATQAVTEAAVAERLRFVAGHCHWACAPIMAARMGLLKQFSVMTFAKCFEDGRPKIDEAQVITPRLGGNFVPGPHSREFATLSAPNVLEMLKKGIADIGAVPGGLLKRPENAQFVKLASLVDCSAGCEFVWPEASMIKAMEETDGKTDCLRDDRGCDSKEFGQHVIRSILKKEAGLKDDEERSRIGIEENTVAEELLAETVENALRGSGLDLGTGEAIERLRWPYQNSSLDHMSFEKLAGQCKSDGYGKLLGLLTWEPHATWVQVFNHGLAAKLNKTGVRFAPGKLAHPHHLQFAIVGYRPHLPRIQRELKQAFYEDLWPTLWDVSEQLNETASSVPKTEMLDGISDFFHLYEPGAAGVKERHNRAKGVLGGVLYEMKLLLTAAETLR